MRMLDSCPLCGLAATVQQIGQWKVIDCLQGGCNRLALDHGAADMIESELDTKLAGYRKQAAAITDPLLMLVIRNLAPPGSALIQLEPRVQARSTVE